MAAAVMAAVSPVQVRGSQFMGSASSSSATSSAFFGRSLRSALPSKSTNRTTSAVVCAAAATEESTERLRLGNLRPAPGARRPEKRKGRGPAAGQGATCGFGMRGQKSRSGSGVRPGFEGGQTPLYRRLPKLRGIAGGMGAGLPKFVTVNLRDVSRFEANSEVSLEALVEMGVLKPQGRERKLLLKVLGDGEIGNAITVKAAAFSASAKAAIEAAGGTCVVVEGRKKWTRQAAAAAAAAAAASS
eukprot:jgi/Chlat1/5344/Chrsp35S05270